jgi:hypothetical protein
MDPTQFDASAIYGSPTMGPAYGGASPASMGYPMVDPNATTIGSGQMTMQQKLALALMAQQSQNQQQPGQGGQGGHGSGNSPMGQQNPNGATSPYASLATVGNAFMGGGGGGMSGFMGMGS